MRVNNSINDNSSFGRAFTTKEMGEFKEITRQARNVLDTKTTSMIIFDSTFPTKAPFDTGIGSSFSKEAQKLVAFAKDMFSVNNIQLGPQGTITKSNFSPYSGSCFAIGPHTIDLEQLTEETFGKILPKTVFEDAVKSNATSSQKGNYKVNYASVLGKDGIKEDIGCQNKALHAAFDNFKILEKNSNLKTEFNNFVKEEGEWLDRDSLFEALKEKHGTDDWERWDDDLDKNLFSGKYSQDEVNKRINDIKKDSNETIEYNKFCQFIASKQQTETGKNFEKMGVTQSGDCPIAFSLRENWAYNSSFMDNTYLGCKNDNGSIEPWGFAMPEISKLGTINEPGDSGKLFKNKFDLFFKRYAKGRIDAAYQLINPLLYSMENGVAKQKPFGEIGTKILDFVENSAKKYRKDYTRNDLSLELLGGDAWSSLQKTKNDWPHIQLTRYAGENWGRAEFYKNNMGYSPDKMNLGIGTHDDISLMELTDTKMGEQYYRLANDLGIDPHKLENNKEEFRNAKFGELFTTKNQFFTIFDSLGMNQQFNKPSIEAVTGKPCSDNWSARVPQDYENFYHKQLTEGKGLNLPKALLTAIKAQFKANPTKLQENENLIAKLEKASDILKKEGPYNRAEADATLGAKKSEL